jgi:hypothetical protein
MSNIFFSVNEALLRKSRATKMPKVRKKKIIMFLITLTSIISVLFFLSSGEDLNFVDKQNEELLIELKQLPRPFIRPDIIEEPYKGNFNRKF